jgi:holo-[acyl-carrier protein] synthase
LERNLTLADAEAFMGSTEKVGFLAKRFAAKEAAAKALGTGIARGVTFHDLWITHNALGAPSLHVTPKVMDMLPPHTKVGFYLSVSDEQECAIAFVVIEIF